MTKIEYFVDESGVYHIANPEDLANATRNVLKEDKRRAKTDEILARLHSLDVPAACKLGHSFNETNLYITPKGKIRCRQCRTERRWKLWENPEIARRSKSMASDWDDPPIGLTMLRS